MRRIPSAVVGTLAGWLAVGVCISVVLLSWFGYRAIVEWRRSSVLLAERRARETADLLVEALTRDMRGVQESVLSSLQWNQVTADRPHQVSNLLANAFARYPYPESFFAWSDTATAGAIFFNRADRRPPWIQSEMEPNRFPVIIERQPDIARTIVDRVLDDAARGRAISAFNTRLGGVSYQVVARLTYRDPFRLQPLHIAGFTVNLAWVQQHYFSELTRQVSKIGADSSSGLTLRITDSNGALVAGTPGGDASTLTSRHQFGLRFFDPDLVFQSGEDADKPWSVEVSAAGDESLLQAISGANRTLMIGAVSALILAVGLVLTVRAERSSAKLAEMRSDFVSTVTHELKTPIATIRAAAETLSKGHLSSQTLQGYGRLVTLEAKRLGRLVENLLAYARITDVADVYTFEPLEIGVLFKDIQQEFESQLDEAGFDLHINIAPDLPAIRGDRLALRLLFDNLIDNAIKYSDKERNLRLSAVRNNGGVAIEVTDTGIGIAAEEISRVTKKFVRGRGAVPGGSGLGLAIASRIAADHGATLDIRSNAGMGTTVTVTLPMA